MFVSFLDNSRNDEVKARKWRKRYSNCFSVTHIYYVVNTRTTLVLLFGDRFYVICATYESDTTLKFAHRSMWPGIIAQSALRKKFLARCISIFSELLKYNFSRNDVFHRGSECKIGVDDTEVYRNLLKLVTPRSQRSILRLPENHTMLVPAVSSSLRK